MIKKIMLKTQKKVKQKEIEKPALNNCVKIVPNDKRLCRFLC